MDKRLLDFDLRQTEAFFRHEVGIFSEADSGYAPQSGMMTVAQQIAHVAQTNEWYVDGATSGRGFDVDFDRHMREVAQVTSIDAALRWLGRSFDKALDFLHETSDADLDRPLPQGLILGGVPRRIIFLGIIDHTAHHRGSLALYARCLGRTPPMPYEPQTEW